MFAFAKVSENAVLPKRQNPTDAGMDLSACVDMVVPANGMACIDTGIAVMMPPDCYARIAPRSGLAYKNAIDVLAGVVDCGYTASIKVILINHSECEFSVKSGDRIAQLIFEKIYTPTNVPEFTYAELKAASVGNRGLQGFGSTGV